MMMPRKMTVPRRMTAPRRTTMPRNKRGERTIVTGAALGLFALLAASLPCRTASAAGQAAATAPAATTPAAPAASAGTPAVVDTDPGQLIESAAKAMLTD